MNKLIFSIAALSLAACTTPATQGARTDEFPAGATAPSRPNCSSGSQATTSSSTMQRRQRAAAVQARRSFLRQRIEQLQRQRRVESGRRQALPALAEAGNELLRGALQHGFAARPAHQRRDHSLRTPLKPHAIFGLDRESSAPPLLSHDSARRRSLRLRLRHARRRCIALHRHGHQPPRGWRRFRQPGSTALALLRLVAFSPPARWKNSPPSPLIQTHLHPARDQAFVRQTSDQSDKPSALCLEASFAIFFHCMFPSFTRNRRRTP